MAGSAAVEAEGDGVNPYCDTHIAVHSPAKCARYALRQQVRLLLRVLILSAFTVLAMVWLWR